SDLRIDRASIDVRPHVGALAVRLGHAMRSEDRTRSLLATGLALEIVAFALEGGDGAPAPPWLARAHERIHAEFRADTSVGELAREAGVHPVHFARAFRAKYKLS